jgi:hypothetical protein
MLLKEQLFPKNVCCYHRMQKKVNFFVLHGSPLDVHVRSQICNLFILGCVRVFWFSFFCSSTVCTTLQLLLPGAHKYDIFKNSHAGFLVHFRRWGKGEDKVAHLPKHNTMIFSWEGEQRGKTLCTLRGHSLDVSTG